MKKILFTAILFIGVKGFSQILPIDSCKFGPYHKYQWLPLIPRISDTVLSNYYNGELLLPLEGLFINKKQPDVLYWDYRGRFVSILDSVYENWKKPPYKNN